MVVNEFVCCSAIKANCIREFFLNGAASGIDAKVDVSRDDPNRLVVHRPDSSEPWRVTLVDTGEKAMTGARLWRARRYLESEDVLA